MSLLPKSHQEFSQKEYWDTFFKKRGSRAFEWYGEYPELSGHLHKYIKKQDDILIVGCGNSALGRDLYDIGYNKVSNIDISHVAIKQMLSQNEKQRPGLKYTQMDALNMSFPDDSFSVALDKGTLDAIMADDSPESTVKANKYFAQIQRVLKLTGRYICISLLQEHILKTLLDFFPSNNWMFRIVRCFEAEAKAAENGEKTMPTFLVVCTKFKSLPRQILEMNLSSGDKMQRFETTHEVVVHVTSAQNAAFICSGLKHRSLQDNEVSLDLYKPGDDKPRFTVYVVDRKAEARNTQYAAFIVPQGREAEWLFSTKSGRHHLSNITKTNRLAVVTLHRGHDYGTFDDVQTELNDAVCTLAPSNLRNKKIQYLSLGSEVGKRTVRFEGTSELSGAYVVEDVEVDQHKYRRLFYLSSQLVIQSEARLRTIKSKKRDPREVADLTHLTCRHHVYMSLATHLACKNLQTGSVLVVGLGGGGLCSFLHKFLPKSIITAVDVDPAMLEVATKWFGLTQDDRLKVVIQDGVQYLKEIAGERRINAVLFDVDSKDSSIGMSCPPKQFLDDSVLDDVQKIIAETGFFVLNLVLRDAELRPSIVSSLSKKFGTVISYRLAEELNEIFICSCKKIDCEVAKNGLRDASRDVNNFFKQNRSDSSDSVDVDEFLTNLNVL